MRWALASLILLAAAASYSADDGLVRWSPKLPPPPSEEDDGLISWAPGSLDEFLAFREPTGEEALRARRAAERLHRAARDARAWLGRTHRTVEVEDVLLDGAELEARPLAVLAIPAFVKVATDRPSCQLGGASFGPKLLASLASMPFARRRELLYLSAETRAVYLTGILKPLDGGGRYLDAEDFLDVGRIPAHALNETHAILNSTVPLRSDRRDQVEALERIARTVNDRDWPYSPIESLLKDPGSRLERPVSTIAFCGYSVLEGPTPHCRLQTEFLAFDANFIELLVSKLDRSQRALLARCQRLPKAFAVRGHIRKVANGAFYLEAAALEHAGFGASVSSVLNPDYFDSREYRARLEALRESTSRALRDARRRRGPLVELQDLILSPKSFQGRAVAVLGLAWEPHSGPDGLVAGFGYKPWHRPGFALRLEAAPAAKQAVAGWSREPRLVLARGTVREKEGRGYLDAEELADLGELPRKVGGIREVLDYPPRVAKRLAVDAVRAEVAKLKRDGSRAYVLVEDLVLDPRRWLGRAVWVVGLPEDAVIEGRRRHYSFKSSFTVEDRLTATMDRLALGKQKDLLRLIDSYRLVGLAATVKAARNGAFYLETEGFRDLAPIHDVEVNAVR